MSRSSVLGRWTNRLRLLLFFVMNRHRFKRLELKSIIIQPLLIEGSEYISLCKYAIVKSHAWLSAVRLDEHEPELTIGEGSSIGNFNHIVAVRKVIVGKHVLTASGVYISDNVHAFQDIHTPIMHQPVQFKSEVTIGDGSWLGEHVCVIGARIGRNCVIGANAVVTGDIPDYSVAVGAPAKVIKTFCVETSQWAAVDSG